MRILVTESAGFSAVAVQALEAASHTVDLQELDYENLRDVITDYDGLIIRLGISLDASMLEHSKLRFIGTPTTGLNHIDLAAAQRKGIQIISLKDEAEFLRTITPTAELAFGLLLSLTKRIPAAFDSVKHNEWDRDKFIGGELYRKTLGIIGLGRLGGMCARIGEGFGMRILYYDPKVTDDRYERAATMEAVFEQADAIMLHVHLSAETENMITYDHFSRCKPTTYFINTARGELVQEEGLLRALKEGKIAGAGLDVLQHEVGKKKMHTPIVEYAKSHDNVIITPHIGGASIDAMRRTEEFIAQRIVDRFS